MLITDFYRRRPMRALVTLAGSASAALLGVALIGQYGFELHPCELCLKQRVPYALIILIAAAAWLGRVSEGAAGQLALLCAALFALDAGIAVYHSGVEAGVFKGPSGCTNNDTSGQTLEQMRQAILHAELVPCDQPMAHILGLSMASWNAIAATGMTVVTLWLYRRMRRAI